MASLNADKRGNRRVQFKAPSGKRATLYLGRLPLRQARTVKSYVERLLVAAASGDTIDSDTAVWLTRITDELHEKLAAVGLVAERKSATLGEFVERYINGKGIKKPNTAKNYAATQKSLVEFFGADKPLTEITAGDCDNWYDWQVGKGHSPATIGRNVKRARQFFRAAVRHKLCSGNPMADVKAAAQVNKSREFFVTREMTAKVIAACPDAEWRLIVALARYGGLRVPSELLSLRINDVDLPGGRMLVHSPKTEHHPGGESRLVPIFPELRPYLETVWNDAEPGTEYVITRYRQANANLRTQLLRIIERAGVEPWERIFQNMRASRETELTEEFPIQVVCAWIGNSEATAKRAYLMVTDEHFRRATEPAQQKRGDAAGKATHNPTQPAHVRSGNATYKKGEEPVFSEEYGLLLTCTNDHIPPRGVEPLSSD